MATQRELRERAADERAQERASTQDPVHRLGTVAPGYVHVKDPKTGEELVFVPGEALPEWAVKALRDSRVEPDERNVYRVDGGK